MTFAKYLELNSQLMNLNYPDKIRLLSFSLSLIIIFILYIAQALPSSLKSKLTNMPLIYSGSGFGYNHILVKDDGINYKSNYTLFFRLEASF
jgi:hypothetical protein